MMLITDQEASQGEAFQTSRLLDSPEETRPRNPQASYYSARYYDQNLGRFISEDPVGFAANLEFYGYVSNNPVGLTDPMGLSAQDVQRIIDQCKKCIKELDDIGGRKPGEGVLNGWANDLSYWGNSALRYSCYGQAQYVQPCVNRPSKPYDDHWDFELKPAWLGAHTVVIGYSHNKADPAVVCDPWLSRTYTFQAGQHTGGHK